MLSMILNYIFVIGLVCFYTGCVDSTPAKKVSDETSSANQSSNPLITGGLNSYNSTAFEGVPYSFTPESLASGVSVSAVNLPSWAYLNSRTGKITGTPVGYGTYNNIRITAVLGAEQTTIGPFSLQVRGDPLFTYQWHMNNTGQKNFASRGGVKNIDLNLSSVYAQGINGTGVSIAVSDSGLETDHPDIDDNLYENFHKNYLRGSPYFGDPTPQSRQGDHGTSVAGIIAAEAFNDIGGRGIAPGATVAGLNYIASSLTEAITLDQASGNYYLFNYSYGASFVPFAREWESLYPDQINYGFKNGRLGRGSLYIKAVGNSYAECDYFSDDFYNIEDVNLCFSHNANMDTDNVISNMIVVGALNAKGQKSSYSSTGSSLWISAFGGEYGDDDPAILTIDQQSCRYGYSREILIGTDFQLGEDSRNENCDYTHTFNGSSSATPMITGVIALMLQVNPSLSSRAVKDILARTAIKVNDSTFDGEHPFSSGGFFDLSNHQYENNWLTNGAGFRYHNHFGFGRVDGDSAVEMARTYNNIWPEQEMLNRGFDENTYKVNVNSLIPDNSATGLTSNLYINDSLTIEGIQVMVNIEHGRPGDLGIELTSPSGMKSILLNINNSMLIPYDDDGDPVWIADLTDFVLSSNAFYGENSRGTWKLKVVDALGGITGTEYDEAISQSGRLDDWSLNIIGH